MKRHACLVVLALWMTPAAAQQADTPQAAGIDVFASSDADHSNVLKLGLSFDVEHTDPLHYQGVRLESFIFSAKGATGTTQMRGFYRFADTGDRWRWNGTVGTNGQTLLGSGSLYTDEAYRQEYFFERDMIETPVGVSRGRYETYAGAAYDIPLDDTNTITALAGVQKFDGDNWRINLRDRYIFVVEPDWGLSLQLRTRYFWNSSPHASDYFSPRWYFEAVPVIQIRRYYRRWRYEAAVGWGVRRDADTPWHGAGLVTAGVTSPTVGNDWYLKADFTYSNTPVTAGYTYSYEQATLSLLRQF